MNWQAGDQIQAEMVDLGMLFQVLPVTVVHDRSDELVVWFADGTPYQHRVRPDGSGIPRVLSPSEFAALDTQLESTTMVDRAVLAVLPSGRAYEVRLHWDMPGWRFRQWYVNLQTPFERTDRGIRSSDQFLDIVVKPDMTWRWKDAEELDQAVRVDRLTMAEATAIREEGERVVRDIESGNPPFDRSYTLWRPDPSWPIPDLGVVE